jgi:hypothetical protein
MDLFKLRVKKLRNQKKVSVPDVTPEVPGKRVLLKVILY